MYTSRWPCRSLRVSRWCPCVYYTVLIGLLHPALALVYLISQTPLPLPSKLRVFAPAADLTCQLSANVKLNSDVKVFPISMYDQMTALVLLEDGTPLSTPDSDSAHKNINWSRTDPLVSPVFISDYPKGMVKDPHLDRYGGSVHRRRS
jgi:hypothetical protein